MHDSPSALIRAQLPHPIIDADCHWLEPLPILFDYLREEGGQRLVDAYVRSAPHSERHKPAAGVRCPPWWVFPSDTMDRATAMMPALLRNRLDEFGIDVAITYPTVGLLLLRHPDEDFRVAACRALNRMTADLFAPCLDRLVPVAAIPAHTPGEAIAALSHAVRNLGFRAVLLPSIIQRPLDDQGGTYTDPLALDSVHDYDPLWATCVEHGVAVTVHSGSSGLHLRQSRSNFTYNHIGHFAAANASFAKALLLGGVLRRFPTLPFALLEGGCSWASALLVDVVEHFRLRRPDALYRHLRPSNLDVARMDSLMSRWGGERYAGHQAAFSKNWDPWYPGWGLEELDRPGNAFDLDDFRAAGVSTEEQIHHQFDQLYIGSEAGNPSTALAFDRRLHPRLNVILGTDIGHFDVQSMANVVAEAHELVKRQLLDPAEFRKFVCDNAAQLHTRLNRNFFDGTILEEHFAPRPGGPGSHRGAASRQP